MVVLDNLANIVLVCKTGHPRISHFPTLKDAADFFREHCYYPSIGLLRRNKEEESACYEGSSRLILHELAKLPLKKNTEPPPCEPDFIHVCGGQAVTMAENIYTLRELIKRHVGPKPCIISVGGHVYHSYPETLDQFNVATDIMDSDFEKAGHHTRLPSNYAFTMIKHALGARDDIRIVPFNKPEKEMKLLLERISTLCPDRPLVGIVISTQPEQLETMAESVFGRTAHTVHMAYIQNPKAARLKAKYWGESGEVAAAFGLLDLTKVLYEQTHQQ